MNKNVILASVLEEAVLRIIAAENEIKLLQQYFI